MIGIKQICDSIINYVDKRIKPFPQIPRPLLTCSMMKRPGLSVIRSVSNITKDLNKLGIPTGPMPDGSPNLTVAVAYAITKEVFRALKFDAVVQSGTVPGTFEIIYGSTNASNGLTVGTVL